VDDVRCTGYSGCVVSVCAVVLIVGCVCLELGSPNLCHWSYSGLMLGATRRLVSTDAAQCYRHCLVFAIVWWSEDSFRAQLLV